MVCIFQVLARCARAGAAHLRARPLPRGAADRTVSLGPRSMVETYSQRSRGGVSEHDRSSKSARKRGSCVFSVYFRCIFRRWLDRKTKSIAVQLLLYNGQVDPLLCSVTLHFQFLRTGFVVATAVDGNRVSRSRISRARVRMGIEDGGLGYIEDDGECSGMTHSVRVRWTSPQSEKGHWIP